MSRVYVATFSSNAIEEIKKYGVNIELNDICISESLDEDKVQATLENMRSEINESGAEEVIMHGPFTEIIPSSIDHRAVEFGMKRLEEAYQVCMNTGVKRMVVHSGYMPLLYFKEWHHERSVEFWRSYMKDKGDFQIYIENVFEDEPEMMAALIDELDDPRIRICLDVGHANAVTSPEYDVYRWIEILGHRIGHMHLHNNDGTGDQHSPLMLGTLDMERVLKCVHKHCGDQVTLTIESRECGESIRWLKEFLE